MSERDMSHTPSFRSGFLTEFEMNAMSEFQRDVLKLVCDQCNWTPNFVHVTEFPSGWEFKIINRATGNKLCSVGVEDFR